MQHFLSIVLGFILFLLFCIAMFKLVYNINDADGSLTFVGTTGVPAGVTPAFLDIAPNGKFAYIASKAGAEVFEYSIDSSTGSFV